MKSKLYILFTVACIALSGCAKESGGGAPPPADGGGNPIVEPNEPIVEPGEIPTAPGNDGDPSTSPNGGSTGALNATNSAMSNFFYNSVPNNPRNITINIDLTRPIDSVVIRYDDDNGGGEAGLGIVHPTNSNVRDNRYNGWVTQNGKKVWKGFFQDKYGAIVLIIDSSIGTGDGAATSVGGSVWFQNFNSYWPQNPQQGPKKMCWLISIGPYDCRSFLMGDSVVMNSSATPTTKGDNAAMYYQKLGTFFGIVTKDAGF